MATYRRITEARRIDLLYRRIFATLTTDTLRRRAIVGYKGESLSCRIAWSRRYGWWVMYPPRTWSKNLILIGTQNPEAHRSRSLNIVCQINVSESSSGRRRAGALLARGTDLYLGHNGGIGGSKRGIGKSTFLPWYRQHVSDTHDAVEPDGSETPYILLGKVANPDSILSGVTKFVFSVERFKRERDSNETIEQALERDAGRADDEGEFEPGNLAEENSKILRQINLRRGQPEFRRKLLKAYGGRCAVSGCDCFEALEAAHIRRYGGLDTNHIQNGLLLRSDIHGLFDLGKIAIDPTSLTVIVAREIRGTTYGRLHGKRIRLPKRISDRPNADVLREHRQIWNL